MNKNGLDSTYNDLSNHSNYSRNKKSKKIIIFTFILILAGVFLYIRKSNHAILINEDNIKNTNFDIANLIGSWKTHSTTEPKDNRYYIYDLVFVFKKDGTCNLDGSMRVKYTNGNKGNNITINQNGKCYLNSTGDKLKMDLNDNRTLVFYDEWTDFKMSGELLVISDFSYNKFADD